MRTVNLLLVYVMVLAAQAPAPGLASIANAASFVRGPVVPGSLATLFGSKLSGGRVSVAFDGLPAVLYYVGDQQINLQVPPELVGKATAQAVVTLDGVASAPLTVVLAPVAPGIFDPGGIRNPDWSVNEPSSPARLGSVVQIFATGLGTGVTITARVGGRPIAPDYGGPAPGLPGVQQVNIAVPSDLRTGLADLQVCGATNSDPICSPPLKIYLRE